MRGRTFNNAFVIVDEAQNTTSVQMKMVLTRLGEGSRMVINGDLVRLIFHLDRFQAYKNLNKYLLKLVILRL